MKTTLTLNRNTWKLIKTTSNEEHLSIPYQRIIVGKGLLPPAYIVKD